MQLQLYLKMPAIVSPVAYFTLTFFHLKMDPQSQPVKKHRFSPVPCFSLIFLFPLYKRVLVWLCLKFKYIPQHSANVGILARFCLTAQLHNWWIIDQLKTPCSSACFWNPQCICKDIPLSIKASSNIHWQTETWLTPHFVCFLNSSDVLRLFTHSGSTVLAYRVS